MMRLLLTVHINTEKQAGQSGNNKSWTEHRSTLCSNGIDKTFIHELFSAIFVCNTGLVLCYIYMEETGDKGDKLEAWLTVTDGGRGICAYQRGYGRRLKSLHTTFLLQQIIGFHDSFCAKVGRKFTREMAGAVSGAFYSFLLLSSVFLVGQVGNGGIDAKWLAFYGRVQKL